MNGEFVTQREIALVAKYAWADAVELCKPPADANVDELTEADIAEWGSPGNFGPTLVACFEARVRLLYAVRQNDVDKWDESSPNLTWYMEFVTGRDGWSL